LVIYSSFGWARADADNSTTTQLIGVALGTNPLTKGILLRGYIRLESYSFTIGKPLYVSRNPGEFVANLSGFTAGDYVRLMGYQIATNTIYFNPDNTWVEL
jgi:hypothetical protein